VLAKAVASLEELVRLLDAWEIYFRVFPVFGLLHGVIISAEIRTALDACNFPVTGYADPSFQMTFVR
jgi:hypothetical protein